MSEHRTIVGPTVSWDCPSCGEHVTTSRIVGWDSLDAAWAEAEAARSEFALLRVQHVPWWKAAQGDTCEARMGWWAGNDRPMVVESAYAQTPVAALRALTAKLREVA